jgi:hypothetical protein
MSSNKIQNMIIKYIEKTDSTLKSWKILKMFGVTV